ncbi:hypothetical protein B7P43_G09583 [Cryptotermes secundus]|uniref:Uncharacterized protein n=1 Tax=Cryptotermes secundus TaxID=105785 RepID=A0A2J7RQ59_9NEOP|nr:hypothetical protein B7P43_G09583 [Cryptotermes secundus]
MLGTAAAGSTKLMLISVEAASSKVAPKLKLDFALCTISVDVLGFSLVKLLPLNENMALFAMSSFTSDDRRFFGSPPGSFWSSLDAGGWNCECCGIPKENAVCESELVSAGFTTVSDADGDIIAGPKLKPVEAVANVHASVVLGILSDVTLGSVNVKNCMFDEDALSDSFTGTPALSIPKLTFMAECNSEPGLAPPQATHFSVSLLFCTIHFEQFHIPDVFLNPSPNNIPTVDCAGDV